MIQKLKFKIQRFWDEEKVIFMMIIALCLFTLGLVLGSKITERNYELQAEMGLIHIIEYGGEE